MNQNPTQEQNENNAKGAPQHKPTRIRIEPVEMGGLSKTKFLSTQDFMKMINKIFSAVTPDYEGSKIEILPNGEINGYVYFAEKGAASEGQFKAIEGALSKGGAFTNKTAGAIYSHNVRNTSYKRYELTDKCKEAFEEFIPRFPKNLLRQNGGRKPEINWGVVVKEEQEQAYNGMQAPVFVKIPIDLNKLLSKVYGYKGENGSNYYYIISINRPISSYKEPNGNIIPTNWLLSIAQLNDKALFAAFENIGGSPMQNTLGIFKG